MARPGVQPVDSHGSARPHSFDDEASQFTRVSAPSGDPGAVDVAKDRAESLMPALTARKPVILTIRAVAATKASPTDQITPRPWLCSTRERSTVPCSTG